MHPVLQQVSSRSWTYCLESLSVSSSLCLGQGADALNWASSEPLVVLFANPVVILCSTMRQGSSPDFTRFFFDFPWDGKGQVSFLFGPLMADGAHRSPHEPLHFTH